MALQSCEDEADMEDMSFGEDGVGGGGTPALHHVDIHHQRQVQAKEPPAMGQADRIVGCLLR